MTKVEALIVAIEIQQAIERRPCRGKFRLMKLLRHQGLDTYARMADFIRAAITYQPDLVRQAPWTAAFRAQEVCYEDVAAEAAANPELLNKMWQTAVALPPAGHRPVTVFELRTRPDPKGRRHVFYLYLAQLQIAFSALQLLRYPGLIRELEHTLGRPELPIPCLQTLVTRRYERVVPLGQRLWAACREQPCPPSHEQAFKALHWWWATYYNGKA